VNTTSQKTAILRHMRTQGPITPLLALKLYQSFRLASRIEELRRDGWLINSRLISKNGKRFSEYSLAHVKQGGTSARVA
jgi:hypothetical protein